MFEIEFYETGRIKRVSGDNLALAAVEVLINVSLGISRAAAKGPSTELEDSPELTGWGKNELALCQIETDYPLPPWFPDLLDWVWGLDAKQDKRGEWNLECDFIEAFGQAGLNKGAFLRRVALKLLLHRQKGWRWDPEEKRPIEGLVRSANPEHQVYVVQPRMMHGVLNDWYPGGWVRREVVASE